MSPTPSLEPGSWRARANGVGLLVLRVVAAAFMIPHGVAKLQRFDALWTEFPDPIGVGSAAGLCLAIAAEAGCALLVGLGLATRLAAVPVVFTMLVAALVVHADDPWARKELPLLYGAVFVAVALLGPGPYSLDGVFRSRRDPV